MDDMGLQKLCMTIWNIEIQRNNKIWIKEVGISVYYFKSKVCLGGD